MESNNFYQSDEIYQTTDRGRFLQEEDEKKKKFCLTSQIHHVFIENALHCIFRDMSKMKKKKIKRKPRITVVNAIASTDIPV